VIGAFFMNQSIAFADSIRLSVPSPCRAVALLVDGENLACDLAGQLITASAQVLGPVAVLRVYGNAGLLNGWARAPGFRLIHAHVGKNVTDMLLTVEAMELSFAGQIDGFAIATGDRDFSPLGWSLRSRGFPAVLMSPGPVPDLLSQAFTRHVVVADRRPAAAPAAEPAAKVATATEPPVKGAPLAKTPAKTVSDAKIMNLLPRALGKEPMLLNPFTERMKELGYSKPKNRSWRKHLEPLGAPVEFHGKGPTMTIRLLAGKNKRGA